MELIDQKRQILRVREEYSDTYDAMKWLSPESADQAERTRRELIEAIFNAAGSSAKWGFADTKLYTRELSPGCALCGGGRWSCLFINGICNANCFYCPSEQKDKGVPVTSTVEFPGSGDYADYVDRFNIGGVGFSGGEPLMTFDRVVNFLQTLGKRISRPLHKWMYTNGLLVTVDKLKTLRDSGLNEIRFDLSANGYRLDALEKAVGIIPVVTVEIPAIPEDLEKTRRLVRDLASLGANHLNLHQIRCTSFNRPKLVRRGYTFVHGPGVTVLETELAALELMRYTLDQNIPLPINYCSFTFRRQFQQAGARRRNSVLAKKTWENLTPTGFIRNMSLHGEADRISLMRDRFQAKDEIGTTWNLSGKKDSLAFSEQLWPMVDFSGLRLKLTYSATALMSAVTFRFPYTEIRLNDSRKVIIERDNQHGGIWLEGDDIQRFAALYFQSKNQEVGTDHHPLPPTGNDEIKTHECFMSGLAPYY